MTGFSREVFFAAVREAHGAAQIESLQDEITAEFGGAWSLFCSRGPDPGWRIMRIDREGHPTMPIRVPAFIPHEAYAEAMQTALIDAVVSMLTDEERAAHFERTQRDAVDRAQGRAMDAFIAGLPGMEAR